MKEKYHIKKCNKIEEYLDNGGNNGNKEQK